MKSQLIVTAYITVIRNHELRQLLKKVFISPYITQTVRHKFKEGTQDKNPMGGYEKETFEESCLLACSSCLAQSIFLYKPKPST